MIGQLRSVDANKESQRNRKFSLPMFRKLLGLAAPYKQRLALGLMFTIAFAGLHTVSIVTAFPVLKILLEKEGLTGWVNRTLVSGKTGIDFAPAVDKADLVVMAVSDRSGLRGKIAAGDRIIVDRALDPADQLGKLAELAEGQSSKVTVVSDKGETALEISAGGLDTKLSILRWTAARIPSDTATDDGKLRTLVYILSALVVLVFLANLFRFQGEVLIATSVLAAMVDLRALLYERVLQLPMSFFATFTTSDLVTNFIQDTQMIQRGLMTFFGKFIREPLKALLVLALAFSLDWRITLTMVVVVPVTVLVFSQVGKRVKKANRRLLQGYSYMIDALTASLQNLPVVKVFTAEQRERKHLSLVDKHMFKQQVKLARLQAFVSPMIEIMAVVAASVATIWLASKVVDQSLPLSTFGTLGVALAMMFDPLRKLTDVYVRLQQSTVGAERIFSVLEMPIERDMNQSHESVAPLRESVEFDAVTYTYPGSDTPALVDINLKIARGETIALVGPNGCGKTTLVSMIPRLRAPDAGEIRYDGRGLGRLDLTDLRRQISMVSQDAVVFAGTPGDNIAYGSLECVQARVVDAARRAFADEFIRNIPDGYQAVLSERGTSLSGGQRQRMAIARAIYRDAPILIFDEATSQVDSESEHQIQDALKEFSSDRTTILIAHRFNTIQFADRIVVMDKGSIIDIGGHDELRQRCDLYRRLCETQFSG
ncbi:MAG: ABC transporter ATP-binding protein [Planctomycetota bacterium]|jgi:ABC-type multidrug transport system fused ATPase/permease subunit